MLGCRARAALRVDAAASVVFGTPFLAADSFARVSAEGVRPVDAADIFARVSSECFRPFWDALILEAARLSGASRVVTEDLQHGRRLAGVRIEDPFREPLTPR